MLCWKRFGLLTGPFGGLDSSTNLCLAEITFVISKMILDCAETKKLICKCNVMMSFLLSFSRQLSDQGGFDNERQINPPISLSYDTIISLVS